MVVPLVLPMQYGSSLKVIQQASNVGKISCMTSSRSGNLVLVLNEAGLCHVFTQQPDRKYSCMADIECSFQGPVDTKDAISARQIYSFGERYSVCPFRYAAVNALGTRVIFGGETKVAFYDIAFDYKSSCVACFDLSPDDGDVKSVAANAAGTRFFVGCSNGCVLVYERRDGIISLTQAIIEQCFNQHEYQINSLACNYEGTVLIVGALTNMACSNVKIYEFNGDEDAKLVGSFKSELIPEYCYDVTVQVKMNRPLDFKFVNQIASVACLDLAGNEFASITDRGLIKFYVKNSSSGAYVISRKIQLPCSKCLNPIITGSRILLHEGDSINIFDGNYDLSGSYLFTPGLSQISQIACDVSGSRVFIGTLDGDNGDLFICK